VHYPTTSLPGQNGNTAYFGHSSNNIFNPGKYKFAFVLLHEMVPGDTFYLTKDSKVYVYKVFSRTIVDPSNVGVLDPVAGHSATATLITCDPPGTSLKRLVVVGDQISPDPAANTAAAQQAVTNIPATSLPGNGQTLWGRWWQSAAGKLISTAVVIAVLFLIWRWVLAVGR
jgi:LPXTG-site transpeptidase (sortase) family protein